MRLRRLSFIAGWTAVALLAIAGFAAFGTRDRGAPLLDVQETGADLGHTTGAYAGLTFALLAGDFGAPDPSATPPTPAEATEDASEGASTEEEPADVDASGWLSEIEVRALVSAYFKPEDVNRAVRVAWCESRFDPNSVNLRTGAVGLFQHLPKYWPNRAEAAGFPGADPRDPEASVAAAAWAVYNEGGWDVFLCRG